MTSRRLAEAEPDLRIPVLTRIETRPRHPGHAHLINQEARKGMVVGDAQTAGVSHDVIRAIRNEAAQPGSFQHLQGNLATRIVLPSQTFKIRIRQLQRLDPCKLKRCGRMHGQKIMHLPDRIGQLRSRDHPAHTPTGHRERLAHAVHQKSSDWHTREGDDRNVLLSRRR